HGVTFAESSVLGVLSGGISLVLYALTYAWVATRFPWYVAFVGSFIVFSLSTLFLQNITVSLWFIVPVVVAAILIGLTCMPKGEVEPGESKLSQWDIPVRILIGTSFILLLTGIAPFIGSRLTGLLTTIPLYVTILSIFAHRDYGPAAAAHVLRGLLYGMFAFTGFFFILSLLIEETSLGVSFGLAVLTALAIQGTSLLILRRSHQ
ncbi:MAG TPA: hypothetical protein PKI33_11235, partial [Anaerolineales bacterium]|nr:hypothetical protein [Anaerolineales bacterium]